MPSIAGIYANAHPLLMLAWLWYMAAAPVTQPDGGIGTARNQIILGIVVGANTLLQLGKMVMDYYSREQKARLDKAAHEQAAEDRQRVMDEVKKNTAVTVAAATHAGNGAAQVVQDIVREYDDLAERRRLEREQNARQRSAKGTGGADTEVGAGGASGVLPAAPGQEQRPTL